MISKRWIRLHGKSFYSRLILSRQNWKFFLRSIQYPLGRYFADIATVVILAEASFWEVTLHTASVHMYSHRQKGSSFFTLFSTCLFSFIGQKEWIYFLPITVFQRYFCFLPLIFWRIPFLSSIRQCLAVGSHHSVLSCREMASPAFPFCHRGME